MALRKGAQVLSFFVSTFLLLSPQSHAEVTIDTAKLNGINYDVYYSDKSSTKGKPILMALHGCKQDADLFLSGSRIHDYVEKKGFVLLAPSQSIMNNLDHCWNWFTSDNQQRGSKFGDMKNLMAIYKAVQKKYKTDGERAYLAGMSSGAGMAANLAMCYPDVFSGVAMNSGIPFSGNKGQSYNEIIRTIEKGSAYSQQELIDLAYNCSQVAPEDLRLKKVMIVHGANDERAVVQNSDDLYEQFRGFFQKVFDGKPKKYRESVKKHKAKAGKYAYTKQSSCSWSLGLGIQYLRVTDMEHAWSGGDGNYPHTDPKGPSTTQELIKLFF